MPGAKPTVVNTSVPEIAIQKALQEFTDIFSPNFDIGADFYHAGIISALTVQYAAVQRARTILLDGKADGDGFMKGPEPEETVGWSRIFL